MKVSNCCGHPPVGNSEEMGICPDCKEHCEYIDDDPYGYKESMKIIYQNYPHLDMVSPKYRAYYGQIKNTNHE